MIDEGTILSWSGEADSPPDPSVKLEGLRILVKDTRLENWKQAGDIWAFGYFKHDWAESNLPVTVKGDGEVVSSFPSIYGVDQGQRLYFYNLFEEIDQPGEWYLDRETGLLYLYPPKNAESVSFVADEYPFFVLEGSSRITLKGLRFKKGIGNGIKISNAREVTVVDCMISLVSNDALVIDNSVECEAVNNIIYDVGASGIVIRCGDRKTLTPGDTKAINNTITRFSQIRTTYTPGIDLQGVGNTALHNQISDAPHFAIRFGGNDHTIEYNDISKVCTDTVDSGAIYAGRDWTCRGNRIRYNYIHDMKLPECNTGFKIHAVYLDDMFSSAEVFGNIFYKIESVALFGGGRNNMFSNNLMIECNMPFCQDERGLEEWYTPKRQEMCIRDRPEVYEPESPFYESSGICSKIQTGAVFDFCDYFGKLRVEPGAAAAQQPLSVRRGAERFVALLWKNTLPGACHLIAGIGVPSGQCRQRSDGGKARSAYYL